MADTEVTLDEIDQYVGKVIAGRFTVEELIGEGGMKIVYRASDSRTDQQVAISLLRPQYADQQDVVNRFLAEATAASLVDHSNIAKVIDRGLTEDGTVYIASEFIEGRTLTQLIKEANGPLHPQVARRIVLQILSVLSAAHPVGVIHRDLKPDNIIVVPKRGRDWLVVKVLDFGIAKIVDGQGRSLQETQAHLVFGTPLYMPPEQYCNPRSVNHRSDLYSVGIILYEMTTGRLPFPEKDAGGEVREHSEVVTDHLTAEPPLPRALNPDISPELEAVILRALAKKPNDRWEDADEFAEALDEAIPEDKEFLRGQRRSTVPLPPRLSGGVALPRISSPAPAAAPTPTPVPEGIPAPLAVERATLGTARTVTPGDLTVAPAVATRGTALTPPPGAPSQPAAVTVVARTVITGIARGMDRRRRWAAPVAALGVGLVAALVSVPSYEHRESAFQYMLSPLSRLFSEEAPAERAAAAAPDTMAAEKEMGVLPTKADSLPSTLPETPAPAPAPAEPDTQPSEIAQTVEEAPAPMAEPAVVTTGVSAPAPTTAPPGYAELLEEGKRAFAVKDYRLAVRKLQEATRLWPEGPDAWRNLGDTLLRQGKRAEAKAAFQEYLRLNPRASDAPFYQGLIDNL